MSLSDWKGLLFDLKWQNLLKGENYGGQYRTESQDDVDLYHINFCII